MPCIEWMPKLQGTLCTRTRRRFLLAVLVIQRLAWPASTYRRSWQHRIQIHPRGIIWENCACGTLPFLTWGQRMASVMSGMRQWGAGERTKFPRLCGDLYPQKLLLGQKNLFSLLTTAQVKTATRSYFLCTLGYVDHWKWISPTGRLTITFNFLTVRSPPITAW